MNCTTTDTHATYTLHQILEAIIIDGFQRMRPETDIKANAESAARAFRAGLVAFTAPPEQITGSGSNAAIPATVNYGGTKDAIPQQGTTGGRFPASTAAHINRGAQQHVESMSRLAALKRMNDAAACDQDQGRAAWVVLLSQAGAATLRDGLAAQAAHSVACASTGDAVQCGCRTATSSVR